MKHYVGTTLKAKPNGCTQKPVQKLVVMAVGSFVDTPGRVVFGVVAGDSVGEVVGNLFWNVIGVIAGGLMGALLGL